MGEKLDSQEAAKRLGVKLSTLYAYVSRGILESYPVPGGRRSLFDNDDIERIRQKTHGANPQEDHTIRIETAISTLESSGPWYRGRPAVDLATSLSFEEVANILWNVEDCGDWSAIHLPPAPDLPPVELMKWAILMSSVSSSLASDKRQRSVVQMAQNLMATIIDVLPWGSDRPNAALVLDDGRKFNSSLAARLAGRLSTKAKNPGITRAINAALILTADHEFTIPTLAIRVAACARTNFHDAMMIGVSSAPTPAHGFSSELAFNLLSEAHIQGAERAMDDALRIHGIIPGFGQTYEQGDPRFDVLYKLCEELPNQERLETIRSVLSIAAKQNIPPPRLDFAMAAMAFAHEMSRDAGRTITVIAHMAGWTAHFLEELEEPPLRFRPQISDIDL